MDVHPPFLDDVVTPGSVVVPLLLAPGHHVHVDIAGAASACRGHGDAGARPGRDADLDAGRAAALGCRGRSAPTTSWCSRLPGRRVAGSDRATREVAHQLSVRLGRPVHVGYGAACAPRLDELVAGLRDEPSRSTHRCGVVPAGAGSLPRPRARLRSRRGDRPAARRGDAGSAPGGAGRAALSRRLAGRGGLVRYKRAIHPRTGIDIPSPHTKREGTYRP